MHKLISSYLEHKQRFLDSLGELERQTDHIVILLAKIFNKKEYWWEWVDNHDDKDIMATIREYVIPIRIPEHIFYDGLHYYNEYIPLIFYGMTDKQITAYIRHNQKLHKRKSKTAK